jgi:hypothetical protein
VMHPQQALQVDPPLLQGSQLFLQAAPAAVVLQQIAARLFALENRHQRARAKGCIRIPKRPVSRNVDPEGRTRGGNFESQAAKPAFVSPAGGQLLESGVKGCFRLRHQVPAFYRK